MTFPAFLLSGEIFCFGVLILDDDVLEGEESVEISITSDDVFVNADPGGLVIFVQDDDDLDGMCINSFPEVVVILLSL